MTNLEREYHKLTFHMVNRYLQLALPNYILDINFPWTLFICYLYFQNNRYFCNHKNLLRLFCHFLIFIKWYNMCHFFSRDLRDWMLRLLRPERMYSQLIIHFFIEYTHLYNYYTNIFKLIRRNKSAKYNILVRIAIIT